MDSSIKLKTSYLLVSALLVTSVLSAGLSVRALSTSQTISTVYISPTVTCCGAPSTPYHVNDEFSVNVSLSLSSGESINGFDVRVNYTNPHSGVAQGVLHPVSLDYSRNIFSSYQTTVLEECIDGQSIPASAQGCTNDVLGQVRLGEFILGKTLSGPLSGELFRILFQVTGYGNSTFVVDRADVVNPIPDQSNPSLIGPADIPLLKEAGIFANQGVVAFFNYQPQDTSVTPSLLPNQPVVFDASASFVPTNSSTHFREYLWDFGDGSTGSGETTPHSFAAPGNYSVSLMVRNDENQTGSITRHVSVMPALGNLALTVEDTSGTLQRGNVQLRLFNSSSSAIPIFNQTSDGNGQANFNRLSPGNYYLTFSGHGIVSGSKLEKVIPGFTQQNTVFVSLVQTPPDYGLLIYLGTFLGAVAIVAAVLIIRNIRSARRSRGKAGRVVSGTARRRS